MCRGNRATVHTVNASILSRLIIIQTACVLPNSPLYVTYPSLSTEQSIVFPWTESSQSMKSYFFNIVFILFQWAASKAHYCWNMFSTSPDGGVSIWKQTCWISFHSTSYMQRKNIIKIPPYSRATRAELLLPDRFSRSIYISVKSPQGFAPLHFL